MTTLLITQSMENQNIYYDFIQQKKLKRKRYEYDGVKYDIILGGDILELINHRLKMSRLKSHYNSYGKS